KVVLHCEVVIPANQFPEKHPLALGRSLCGLDVIGGHVTFCRRSFKAALRAAFPHASHRTNEGDDAVSGSRLFEKARASYAITGAMTPFGLRGFMRLRLKYRVHAPKPGKGTPCRQRPS